MAVPPGHNPSEFWAAVARIWRSGLIPRPTIFLLHAPGEPPLVITQSGETRMPPAPVCGPWFTLRHTWFARRWRLRRPGNPPFTRWRRVTVVRGDGASANDVR